jgi:hypothetical protein
MLRSDQFSKRDVVDLQNNPNKMDLRRLKSAHFLSSFHALSSDTMLELGKENKNLLFKNFSVDKISMNTLNLYRSELQKYSEYAR